MKISDIGSGFLPYEQTVNRDFNDVYRFKWKGTQIWDVTIVIDSLNDDLIIQKNCGCPARQKFRKGVDCKHILEAKRQLRKFGVHFREDELCKEEPEEIQIIATAQIAQAC